MRAGGDVVGGIDADGLEDLGVFSEAVPLEPCFSELAPVLVAGAVVKRSAPAGVLPGGRADVNALDCQGGSLVGQLLPVEVHAGYLSRWPRDCNPVARASFAGARRRNSPVPSSSGSGPRKPACAPSSRYEASDGIPVAPSLALPIYAPRTSPTVPGGPFEAAAPLPVPGTDGLTPVWRRHFQALTLQAKGVLSPRVRHSISLLMRPHLLR